MTVKQFFKSTTFKCIAALLSILLICGVFLTLMNGLLEVTAGEKLQRSIAKVYPGMDVTVYGLNDDGEEVVIDSSNKNPKGYVGETIAIDNSDITEAYKIVYTANGNEVTNYLVTSTGYGGYDNGSVTCNVAIEVTDGKITGIYKVSIQSNVGQSFINRVGDNALNEFVELYKNNIYYSQDMITGATTVKTKTAICNSVNGALAYVDQYILGNEAVNKFEGFRDPKKLINNNASDYVVDGETVTYTLVTNGYDMAAAFTLTIVVNLENEVPTIQTFEIVVNGTNSWDGAMMDVSTFAGKTLEHFEAMLLDNWTYPGDDAGTTLNTGASNSNYNCVYAAAFALYNYDYCINGGGEEPPVVEPPVGGDYTDYIDLTQTFLDAETRTFTVVTVAKYDGKRPNAFTFTITVSEDYTIESFEIVANGSTAQSYTDKMPENVKDGSLFVGKTLEEIETLIGYGVYDEIEGDELKGGATQSSFICGYAAAFALKNIDTYENPVLENDYKEFINLDETTFDKETRTFTVVTTKFTGLRPNAFTFTVTVSEDYTIESIEVVTNGSTAGYDSDMADIAELYVGKTLEEIEVLIANGVYTEGMEGLDTGATMSNFISGYVAAFALKNVDEYLAKEDKPDVPPTPPTGPDWDELQYTQYIDSAVFDAETRTYTIVTASLDGMPDNFTIEIVVAEDKTIESFKIVVNGSTDGFETDMHPDILSLFVGKSLEDIQALIDGFVVGGEDITGVDGQLQTGATRSNFICTYACAFALANYDAYMGNGGESSDTPVYTEYVDSADFEAATRTYTIVTSSLDGMPDNFTIEIVVAENKTIESFKIVVNGSTEDFDADMHPEILAQSYFDGMSLEDIQALIDGFVVGDEDVTGVDGQLQTGATRSNFICAYACAYALANYDYYMGGNV